MNTKKSILLSSLRFIILYRCFLQLAETTFSHLRESKAPSNVRLGGSATPAPRLRFRAQQPSPKCGSKDAEEDQGKYIGYLKSLSWLVLTEYTNRSLPCEAKQKLVFLVLKTQVSGKSSSLNRHICSALNFNEFVRRCAIWIF